MSDSSFHLRLSMLVALPWLSLLGCTRIPFCEALPLHEECTLMDGVMFEKDKEVTLSANRDVDILLIIDNSGSMGEAQAILSTNFGVLIQALEDSERIVNYRLGVTTTDNGNIWCPASQTTPEGGKLVLSSCKTRLGDFLFNNGDVDVEDIACNNICSLSPAELEILPTSTDVDPNEVARPWIEHIEGVTNLLPGVSMEEAFKCFSPQGIHGCGFESQLESMFLALTRAESSGEASYGFLRDAAVLTVIFLTDEVDCSSNKDWSETFASDGSKVFWSDPNSAFPSSAVCWNAGVACEGDPSSYSSCEPMNYDVDGNPQASEANAVFYPVERYIGQLQDIEHDKQQLNPAAEIIVALIGGVDADGTPFYADVTNTDPGFQNSFGIGPGCEAPNPFDPDQPIQAIPPVRLRALVDELTPGNMFSICEQDYSPALESIATRIQAQLPPACYTKCAQDMDVTTTIVEPECTIREWLPGSDTSVPLQECLEDTKGYVISEGHYTQPTPEATACYALLNDTHNETASTADDMSELCRTQGFNLEFELARRPGFPALSGTQVIASCELAELPEQACPDIGI